MKRTISLALAAMLLAGAASDVLATIPYSGAGGPFPGFGAPVAIPKDVGGKEYSHDFDSTTIGALGVVGPPPADPEQIVAWDGIGGTVDVTDFTATRPSWTLDQDIDAIAHHRDFAYKEVKSEIAHLVFSVDDMFTSAAGAPMILPSAGPIVLPIGTIGGAGEASVEEGTSFGAAPSTVGIWAAQGAINGMPLPDDIDGLEVWGPEPPLADADKYSLDVDITSGAAGSAVSVWNASGSMYIPHFAIVGAVTSLLGPDVDPDHINLDALMVHDEFGDPDRFDDGPAGPGDEILFSIRQIPSTGDPSGYYATGSEIFVLNASAPPAFLAHGGHMWDKTYALGAFNVGGPENRAILDVNAIEAIGSHAVPEPGSLVLLLLAASGFGIARSRSRR